MTKQTTIPDFTRIFNGSAAPAAPPPQVIMVPMQQPAAQQQPQMVQMPASVLEDLQRKAREAEDQARREAAQKATSLMAPPPGAQQLPVTETQEAKTLREQVANLAKLVEMGNARAQAAELNAIRERVISAACMQGLHPSMAQFINGADEMAMRASAQTLFAQQTNMEAEFAKKLVTQYGVQQPQQMPTQQPGAIPVGYTMQAQPFQISAPSMISAPAPVPQGQLSMEQLNQLTSHEAMMSGAYGANRNALMNSLRQGQMQQSNTQWQPTPAPQQFQPQGHQPLTAFNAPQSRFVPQQFQPQQSMMPQQQNPMDAAMAAIDRMRSNPSQVNNLLNQGFLV